MGRMQQTPTQEDEYCPDPAAKKDGTDGLAIDPMPDRVFCIVGRLMPVGGQPVEFSDRHKVLPLISWPIVRLISIVRNDNAVVTFVYSPISWSYAAIAL